MRTITIETKWRKKEVTFVIRNFQGLTEEEGAKILQSSDGALFVKGGLDRRFIRKGEICGEPMSQYEFNSWQECESWISQGMTLEERVACLSNEDAKKTLALLLARGLQLPEVE